MNLKAFLHDAAYERHEAGCTCPDYPWRISPTCQEHGYMVDECGCNGANRDGCKVCREQARKTYRSTLED